MFLTITIAAICFDLEHLGRIYLSNPDTVIHNYGMAFSILSDYPAVSICLSVFSTVIVMLVCFARLNRGERIGYSIMLGGALSNCTEKVILGYVIDWIPLPFIPLTINIADIAVSLGVMIAIMSFET